MRKRLGIETDVYALIDPRGNVRGGDYRPRVYWTKATAKLERLKFPECSIVPARIVPRDEPKTDCSDTLLEEKRGANEDWRPLKA